MNKISFVQNIKDNLENSKEYIQVAIASATIIIFVAKRIKATKEDPTTIAQEN